MDCCFFFKQKSAYEMRISDWSSDGCSSDRPRDLKNDAKDEAIDAQQSEGRQQQPYRPGDRTRIANTKIVQGQSQRDLQTFLYPHLKAVDAWMHISCASEWRSCPAYEATGLSRWSKHIPQAVRGAPTPSISTLNIESKPHK